MQKGGVSHPPPIDPNIRLHYTTLHHTPLRENSLRVSRRFGGGSPDDCVFGFGTCRNWFINVASCLFGAISLFRSICWGESPALASVPLNVQYFTRIQISVHRVAELNTSMRPPGSVGNPLWVKGRSGNPAGKPLGRIGKLTPKHVANALEVFAVWMTEQFTFELDPNSPHPESVQILLSFARSDKIPHALRIAAATAASKHEAQFVYTTLEIPDFETIGQAESFQRHVAKLEAQRKIDTKTASTVIGRVQNWINNQRAAMELDIKRLNADPGSGDQHILITGGPPALPGTEVIMPQINGHVIDSVAVEHQPNDSVDHDTKDQAREP
jgi:hypothetical protein